MPLFSGERRTFEAVAFETLMGALNSKKVIRFSQVFLKGLSYEPVELLN
ncbi:hypothetical protein ADU37_CDS18070 [Thermococcus sp. 2319x1]|nr:hypothetical protein ADU37_CDS18070 [Thermococcus sp. 2319x1]